MPSRALTAEYARSILIYDPANGEFTWRPRPRDHFVHGPAMKTWNTRFSGKRAGSLHEGYVVIVIDGRMHRAHRLAWLMTTGAWPACEIDHKDTRRFNNRWDNLREATPSENAANKQRRSDNTSGFKGVNFDKQSGKWRAKLCVEQQHKHLGLFATAIEAHEAYSNAAERYHGEFRRTA